MSIWKAHNMVSENTGLGIMECKSYGFVTLEQSFNVSNMQFNSVSLSGQRLCSLSPNSHNCRTAILWLQSFYKSLELSN